MNKTKLKVTFLLPNDGVGGGVRAIMEFGNGLARRGHDVRIIAKRRAVKKYDIKRICKQLRRGTSRNWLDYFDGPIEYYSENLKPNNFADNEIVVSMCAQTMIDAFQLPGHVKKVLHCHGGEYENWEMFVKAINLPVPTIAISNHVKNMIEKHSSQKVLAVVPNGLHHSEYYPDQNIIRDGVGGCIRGRHSKDAATTIQVFKGLASQLPSTPLYSFGTYKMSSVLGKTRYTHNPSVEQARNIYNKCKVWFLASMEEGFGLPVLEAMGCGCVVVTTLSGGPQDMIIDDFNGFNVEIGNYGGILHCIKKLLGNDSLCKTMSKNAIETSKKYNWDVSASQLESILTGL